MTVRNYTEAITQRLALLGRIKRQTAPNTHPVLYNTSELKFQWYAAHSGDYWSADPSEAIAAAELLEQGYLVPVLENPLKDKRVGESKLLKHFDDVCWGQTNTGKIVIYDLHGTMKNPDGLIYLDETHDAARRKLQAAIETQRVLKDSPVLLNTTEGALVVEPLITDPAAISLRERQMMFVAPEQG